MKNPQPSLQLRREIELLAITNKMNVLHFPQPRAVPQALDQSRLHSFKPNMLLPASSGFFLATARCPFPSYTFVTYSSPEFTDEKPVVAHSRHARWLWLVSRVLCAQAVSSLLVDLVPYPSLGFRLLLVRG